MLVGVDVGGTFTDAVAFDGERVYTAKSPTTPDDQSRGVLAAIEAALERAGRDPADVELLAHGTTVGTNALLTESGARCSLLATEGFTDLLEIARQDRPRLYHPRQPLPVPLAPAEARVGVRERIGPRDVVRDLTDEELDRITERIAELEPESVAICLLFAYRDPNHERRVARRLRDRFPDLHVSASHEVLAQFREFERCSTTVVDAYLSPLLGRYIARLASACSERGLPAPAVMRSSGGLASAEEAGRSGAWSVLSGPAGGAVGAARLATLGGDERALGFDMGGTSCDVCVVESGRVRRTDSTRIGGRPIQLPMVDVHTVGAGGGSIAWRDIGGALRVGPRSAGAEPGPACYGRGGTEPTVSDADLVLGRLPAASLAGGIELDASAAERAVGRLAGDLGLDTTECAVGIARVADAEMVRALRVVTVERGVDPRGYALYAFGGAGPLHAAAVAEQLDIERIVCARAGGVLSALGLAASERRRDTARTVLLAGDGLTAERIGEEIDALETELRAGGDTDFGDEAELELVHELRYAGQSFELAVDAERDAPPDRLRELFEAEHERRYGYCDPGADIELVNLRAALRSAAPELTPRAADPGEGDGVERTTRRVHVAGAWHETEILRGEPAAGVRASGPCVFELPEATFLLGPDWSAEVDERGSVVATRGHRGEGPER
ncbi:hydantoinase/oxoprolinase family protein [Thermoleophilia bacterium SCSIO 60948]|nr:hydantoinase/oxoprolinase family protein [Thermoleophilia bacterium SCSIO 60948]